MSGDQSLFVLADIAKCTGCRACELACFATHQANPPKTVGNVTKPVIPNLYLTRVKTGCMPIQCHHCEDAPCLRSCLPGAITRAEGGQVVVNPKKCIGCKNCAVSCPFGAIQILADTETGTAVPRYVHKCDLCVDKEKPACIANCPNEALRLVDINTELRAKRTDSAAAMELLMGGGAK